MLNDLLVLAKIKDGDIKAFEQVFKLYYTPLCYYSLSITGNQPVSEEIVQELFYVFWKERERIQLFQSLKSYLYKSVKNKSIQFCEHCEVRARHREAMLSTQTDRTSYDPQDMLEYKELNNLINRTLYQLPERRRQIFRMNRFEGKKYAEIAGQLSISIKTVEAEMTKALHQLRKEVENYTYSK